MKLPAEYLQAAGALGTSRLLSNPPAMMPTSGDGPVITATLSPAGRTLAFAQGRAALLKKLREECIAPATQGRAAQVDWHFTDPAAAVETRTAPNGGFSRQPTLPDIIGRDEAGAKQALYLSIPASLAWFNGHFHGDPILPAVVQLDWVMHFGTACGAGGTLDPGQFAGMSRLKFRAVIVPHTVLRLTLEAIADTLAFIYESRDGMHSKGNIHFNNGSSDGAEQ